MRSSDDTAGMNFGEDRRDQTLARVLNNVTGGDKKLLTPGPTNTASQSSEKAYRLTAAGVAMPGCK